MNDRKKPYEIVKTVTEHKSKTTELNSHLTDKMKKMSIKKEDSFTVVSSNRNKQTFSTNDRNFKNGWHDEKYAEKCHNSGKDLKKNKGNSIKGRKGFAAPYKEINVKDPWGAIFKHPPRDDSTSVSKPLGNFQEAPIPKVNVWEKRLEKSESIKEMLPHNRDHEEIMIKQAILLSQQQAIEDSRRRREQEREHELELQYYASIASKDQSEISSEFDSRKFSLCNEQLNLTDKKSTKDVPPALKQLELTSPKVHQPSQFSDIWDVPVSLNDKKDIDFLDSDKTFKDISEDDGWEWNNASSMSSKQYSNSHKNEDSHSKYKTPFEGTCNVQEIVHSDANNVFENSHSYRDITSESFVNNKDKGVKTLRCGVGTVIDESASSGENLKKGVQKPVKKNLDCFNESDMLKRGSNNCWENDSCEESLSTVTFTEKPKCSKGSSGSQTIVSRHSDDANGSNSFNDVLRRPCASEHNWLETSDKMVSDTREKFSSINKVPNVEKFRDESDTDVYRSSPPILSSVTLESTPKHESTFLKSENHSQDFENMKTSNVDCTILPPSVPEANFLPPSVPEANFLSPSVPEVHPSLAPESSFASKLHPLQMPGPPLTPEHNFPLNVHPLQMLGTPLAPEPNFTGNHSQPALNQVNHGSQPGLANSFLPFLQNPIDMIASGLPVNPAQLYSPALLQQQIMTNSNQFFLQQLQVLQMYYASMGVPNPNANLFLPMGQLVNAANPVGMYGYPQSYMMQPPVGGSLPQISVNSQSDNPTVLNNCQDRGMVRSDSGNVKPFSPPVQCINGSYVSQPGEHESKFEDVSHVTNDYQLHSSGESTANIYEKPIYNSETSDMSVGYDSTDFIRPPTMPQKIRRPSFPSSDCKNKSGVNQLPGSLGVNNDKNTGQPSYVKSNFQMESGAVEFSRSVGVNIGSNAYDESYEQKMHQFYFPSSDVSTNENEDMPCIRPPRQMPLDQHNSKSFILEPIRQPKQNPCHALHSMVHRDAERENNSSVTNLQQNVEVLGLPNNEIPKDNKVTQEKSFRIVRADNSVKSNLPPFSNGELRSTLISKVQKVPSSTVPSNDFHSVFTGKTDQVNGQMDFEAWGNNHREAKTVVESQSGSRWSDCEEPEDVSVKKTCGSGIWDDNDAASASYNVPARKIDSRARLNHDKQYPGGHSQKVRHINSPNTGYLRNDNWGGFQNSSLSDFKDMHGDSVTTERNVREPQENTRPLSGIQKLLRKSQRKPNY